MGYEITSFVGQVDKEFVCPICMMVVEQPLELPCEHIFCAKCIIEWTSLNNSCPVDRRELHANNLKTPPRFYRNLWSKLEVRCHMDSMGCDTIVPLENLKSHLTVCTYKPNMTVVCDKGCNLVMTRLEYQKSCFAHLSTYLSDKFEKELEEMKNQIEQLNGKINRQGESMARLVARTSAATPKLTWRRIYNMNMSSDEPNILEPLNTNSFCWAFVQFTRLETSTTSCRIQVMNIGDDEYVVIGLAHHKHFDELPGHRVGSIGYYSRGEIVVNGKAEVGLEKWKNGDIIECGVLFQNNSLNDDFVTGEVYFSINRKTVTKKKMKIPHDGFFPTIRMGSFSKSVPKVEYLTQ
ncbi:E3 ubiquitin-protein ligase NRDP1-like isoform X2 [Bradysia coprophila]|nr:E3 ubiquitin-protein ligase NRDP1-like isoform X2 [Bradysia coprophila]XP_037027734.1 E3 ubiquitin-protein ligase NRDP1-like isoform X2 [Bradysia coprophila]